MSSDASRKARHEFYKSPPGKAGFCISGRLLGECPPVFDKLQKRLAAAAQALARLDRVDQRHRFPRQLEQNLLAAIGAEALAVADILLG